MKNSLIKVAFATIAVVSVNAQQTNEQKPTKPLAEQEQICVLGDVLRPSGLPFKEGVTLLKSIAAASGAVPSLQGKRVVIFRLAPREPRERFHMQEIRINDLNAVAKGDKEDLALRPDDIVIVYSGKKSKTPAPEPVAPCRSRIEYILHYQNL